MLNVPSTIVYPAAGYCIYCGANGRDVELTREHFIPKSLGGHRIIPQASCPECAVLTSKFSRACCSTTFRALRTHHGAPSYRKRKRSTTIPGEFINGEVEEIPAEGNQGVTLYPVLPPPRILIGTRLGSLRLLGFVPKGSNPDFPENIMEASQAKNQSVVGQTDPFALMHLVGQIARGFVVAEGLSQRIIDFIGRALISTSSTIFDLVGGCEMGLPYVIPNQRGTELHHVYPVIYKVEDIFLFAIQVRLFAHIYPDAPVYVAIAGRFDKADGDGFFERVENYSFSPSFGSGGTPWQTQGMPGGWFDPLSLMPDVVKKMPPFSISRPQPRTEADFFQ
jgi:hypothetical protein